MSFLVLLFIASLCVPARAEWLIEYRTDNTQTLFLATDGTTWFTGNEGGRSLIGEIDPSPNPVDPSHSPVRRFYLTSDVELGDLTVGPELLSFGATSRAFVWFLERRTGKIGRLNPQTSEITEWQLPNPNAKPIDITIHRYGPGVNNNTLFFTEYDTNRIGSLRYASGQWILKEFTVPTSGSRPNDLSVDSRGFIWFSESDTNKVARFDPWKAEFSEYPVESGSRPSGVTVDRHNLVWFTMSDANKIARLDPRTATYDTYNVPTDHSRPTYIDADNNGSLWFTEQDSGKIGRFSLNATAFIEYTLPDTAVGPYHINVTRSTGEVWATESRRNGIVRILPRIAGVAATATVTSTTQSASTVTSSISVSTTTMTESQRSVTAVTITAATTATTIATATATTTLSSTTTTTQPASTVTLTLTVTTTTSPSRACIIASAAYGSELEPHVQALRDFRDQKLLSTFAGSQFMQIFNRFYYSFSPQVAQVVSSNPLIAALTRMLIVPLIQILKIFMLISESELGIVVAGTAATALVGLVYLTFPLSIAFARHRENARKSCFGRKLASERWVRAGEYDKKD